MPWSAATLAVMLSPVFSVLYSSRSARLYQEKSGKRQQYYHLYSTSTLENGLLRDFSKSLLKVKFTLVEMLTISRLIPIEFSLLS